MKKSLHIGAAFTGLIVGGGFASGQEIMKFFTSFGWYGIFGAVLAAIGFSFLGMNIVRLGSELQTTSHKEVFHYIAGRKFGTILDVLITFFLFCITVAMFAGTASAFELMFGKDGVIGSFMMAVITVLTLMLNIKNIVHIISCATPYLLAVILVISFYSIFTNNHSLVDQHVIAIQQSAAAPNWMMGSLLYVSYNIAAGAAMLTVIGGTEKDRRIASSGGIIGGILLGILILLINIAMFAKMDVIQHTDMPILELAIDIHPYVGVLMAVVLLGMLYSTAVGMFYSFVVRFVSPRSMYYKPAVVFFGTIAFFASFIGFTTLVSDVYSMMGYLGIAIIIAIVSSWIKRMRK